MMPRGDIHSVCDIMGDVPEDIVTFSRDTEAGPKVDLVLVQMDSSPTKNNEIERK